MPAQVLRAQFRGFGCGGLFLTAPIAAQMNCTGLEKFRERDRAHNRAGVRVVVAIAVGERSRLASHAGAVLECLAVLDEVGGDIGQPLDLFAGLVTECRR